MNNPPPDVMEVWVRQSFPMGRDSLDWCNRIIEVYPEWFPWEHTYKNIPKEVHEAYFKEKYGDWAKWDGKPRKGLWELMQEKPRKKRKTKPVDLRKAIADMFEFQEKARKRKERERNKAKKLWDKYYKQYKLEYRE